MIRVSVLVLASLGLSPAAWAGPTAANGCAYGDDFDSTWNPDDCGATKWKSGEKYRTGYEISGDGKAWLLTPVSVGYPKESPVCPRKEVADCIYAKLDDCIARDQSKRGQPFQDCMSAAYKGAARSAHDLSLKAWKSLPLETIPIFGKASLVADPNCQESTGKFTYAAKDLQQTLCLRTVAMQVEAALDKKFQDMDVAISGPPYIKAIVQAACGADAPKDHQYTVCLTDFEEKLQAADDAWGNAGGGLAALEKTGFLCEFGYGSTSGKVVGNNPAAACWNPLVPLVGHVVKDGDEEKLKGFPLGEGGEYYKTAKANPKGAGAKGNGQGSAGGAAGGSDATAGLGGSGGGYGSGTSGGGGGAVTSPPKKKPDPKPQPGKKDDLPGGVENGKGREDCGKNPDGTPVDCMLQSLVPVEDKHGDDDAKIADCPSFLKPYNCVPWGTQLAGDLGNIRNAPDFYPSRERICRVKVTNYFAGTQGLKMAKELNDRWDADTAPITRDHSPACQYWTSTLLQKDPIPELDNKTLAHGLSAKEDPIHDGAEAAAQIALESGLYRDLGVYSVKEQVKRLFGVMMNLHPEIATGSDAEYDAAEKDLLSAASCLNSPANLKTGLLDEKQQLRDQLKEIRERTRKNSDFLAGQKDKLDRTWAKDLYAHAARAQLLDKAQFDAGQLWGRLGCSQGWIDGMRNDLYVHQCLNRDYDKINSPGDQPLDPKIVESRLSWFKSEFPESIADVRVDCPKDDKVSEAENLAGCQKKYEAAHAAKVAEMKEKFPGSYLIPTAADDPVCPNSYRVDCNDLQHLARAAKRQLNSVLTQYPLLGEATGEKITKRSCDGKDPAELNVKLKAWAGAQDAIDERNGGKSVMGFGAQLLGATSDKCERPEIVADWFVSAGPDTALGVAKLSAKKVLDESRQKIVDLCAKKDGLTEEGRNAPSALSEDYLACKDTSPNGTQCQNRRSFGWAMCWDIIKHVSKRNNDAYWASVKSFAIGAAIAAATVLSLGTATPAVVAAAAIGAGVSAYSIYARHQEMADSKVAAERSQVNYRNGWGTSYDQFSKDWTRMEDSEKDWVAADIMDASFILLDGAGAGHAFQLAKEKRYVEAVNELIKEGKGKEAFEAARKLTDGNALLREARLLDLKRAKQGKAASVLDDVRKGMRKVLEGLGYGSRLAEKTDAEIGELYSLEKQIQKALEEGKIDEETARKIRREVSDAVENPSCKL